MTKISSVSGLRDPVFIVGNSRSGTTLMSRILKLHSKVYFLNETFMFDEVSGIENDLSLLTHEELKVILSKLITIQRKGYYRREQIENYSSDVNAILEIYFSQEDRGLVSLMKSFYSHEADLNNKTIYGDQTPRHVFSINWLVEMFPGCKIINMVRDPRAILLSQKNKWKASRKLNQPDYEVWRTRFNYHPFTISLLWNRSIDAGEAAKKFNSKGVKITKTVVFEEFVKDAENCMRDICEFIDIDFEQEMMNVDVEMSSNASEDGKQGVSSTIANTWKSRLSQTEQVICEMTVGNRLKLYDYAISQSNISIISLIGWVVLWPIHIVVVFMMNMGRMGGNPFVFLISRLRPNK
jgi:omega-hydroxy-beta-dihydromenaquinone-9 sulfotransferase